MRQRGILLFFYLSLFFTSKSQITFHKTQGSPTRQFGRTMPTIDRGFLSVVTSDDLSPNGKVFVIKSDSMGDTLWCKAFWYPPPSEAAIAWFGMLEQDTGKYIVCMYHPASGYGNFVVLDQNGDSLYSKPGFGPELHSLLDGGILLTGTNVMIKYDSLLNPVWFRKYGGPTSLPLAAMQTSDSGFVFAATTSAHSFNGPPDHDYFLCKTDKYGIPVWMKTFGTDSMDWVEGITRTFDGGFVMVGVSWINSGSNEDFLVVKTDSIGNLQWGFTYGGPWRDRATKIIPAYGAPGYIISGTTGGTDSPFWGERGFLIKIDLNGNIVWANGYGSFNPNQAGYDHINFLYPSFDAGYVLSGFVSSLGFGDYDAWFIKTDLNGNSGCHETALNFNVSNPNLNISSFYDYQSLSYGLTPIPVLMNDTVLGNGVLCSSNIPTDLQTEITIEHPSFIYPNPCTDFTILQSMAKGEYYLIDISGKVMLTGAIKIGENRLSTGVLDQGIYFLVLNSDLQRKSYKLIKQ